MAGQKDGDAFAGQGTNQVSNFSGALRVKTIGGFIKHQEVSGLQQRIGDAKALLHPEGVFTGFLVCSVRETYSGEGIRDPVGPSGGCGEPICCVHTHQVRSSGEVRVEGWALHKRTDLRERLVKFPRYRMPQH